MMWALIRDDPAAFRDMNTIRNDELVKRIGKWAVFAYKNNGVKYVCLSTIIMICLIFVIWSVLLMATQTRKDNQ